MSNFFKSMGLKARMAFASFMLGFASAPAALAQSVPSEVGEIMNGTASGLNSLLPGIIRVLKIIIIIGAAISLLMVVFNIIQGERDSAKKAGWWLVGLVIGFVILNILGNMVITD